MSETTDGKFRFTHHVIDTDLEGVYWGQTALADLDGDGDLGNPLETVALDNGRSPSD